MINNMGRENFSTFDNEKNARRKVIERTLDRLNYIFGVTLPSLGFEERKGQEEFAQYVTGVFEDMGVLVQEAGVGIGKSFGYLIPLLIYMDEIKKWNSNYEGFTLDKNPIIISTFSIVLQEQLVKDINDIGKILGLSGVKVSVAKGMNNYACLKKAEYYLTNNVNIDNKTREILTELLTMHSNITSRNPDISSIDRKNIDIKKRIWEKINADSINRKACPECKYYATCKLPSQLQRLKSSDIVIANHSYLGYLTKVKNTLVKNAGAVVIDEAHNLADMIRSTYEESFSTFEINTRINNLVRLVNESIRTYDKNEVKEFVDKKIKIIKEFYRILENTTWEHYIQNKDNDTVEYKKCTKAVIPKNNSKITKSSKNAYDELSDFLKIVTGIIPPYKRQEASKDIEYLKRCCEAFRDMYSNGGKYIYWAAPYMYNDLVYVDLVRTPKNLEKIMAEIINGKPSIFTSATLTTANYDGKPNYEYFKENTGLTKLCGNAPEEDPIPSPYDYKNNSLFYYDTTTVSPKDPNRRKYISNLSCKISELLEITEGKTLVLFTNKTDMVDVYKRISLYSNFPFELLLHSDSKDQDTINRFKNNIDSVLFSTGTWEGLNIPGKSLSNVIITKLPYPVNDPIVNSLADDYDKNEAFSKVILPNMFGKLSQGIGRVIRDGEDKGCVTVLDSRLKNKELRTSLIGILHKGMPVTSSIDDFIKFCGDKGINTKKNPH